jgi:hypothetical protein
MELAVQEQTQQTVTNYVNRVTEEEQECEQNPNLKICASKVVGNQTIDQYLGICEGSEWVGGTLGFAGSWELFSGGLTTIPESGGWSLIPAAVGFVGMGISSLGLFGGSNVGPIACNGKG